ncbi:hypothetical protein TSUD_38210 [Trifolium subterraneum]|uniref:Beta-glucosidase n=1 Tax=Trifolium subterraneum TaxID=3900 RepID=A0A2Z6N3V3_TRISU|nr:hypothetical protein TSUD_38210 [Trifolium subterraneum]
MERDKCLILVLFLLLNLAVAVGVLLSNDDDDNYSRYDFPDEFVFGSGTSAYQVEGAADEDGRTPSIWDTFAHDGFAHGGNGDVACDVYHKYKEDVQLMVETGLEAFRFSISWSRLIPNGRGPVNPKGLQYYNNLINELISNGIQPHVTLYNYDLPQALEDEYGGWLSRDVMIMEPLLHGDYPKIMKENAGARIPAFTSRESKQVKGSYDFIGIIHYSKFNGTDIPDALKIELRDFSLDSAAVLLAIQDILTEEEYPIAPLALREVLDTFKILYGNPPIFIHENGQRTASNASLHDVSRVEYLHAYIGTMLDSLRNGSNIKGYFAWSFIDALELLDGYKSSFGLYYVDRNDPELTRYPKLSAKWYNQFLKGGRSSQVGAIQLKNDSSLVSVRHLFQ